MPNRALGFASTALPFVEVVGDEPIRVLVVDDDDLLARLVSALLASDERMEEVGRARTGEVALVLVEERAPHVVVMDVEMPGIGGLEATKRITTGGGRRGPAVLVVTGADVEAHWMSARAAGAAGYLPKADLPERLLPTIRAIAAARSAGR
jgi:DNA-binding NarL/FixJ family response regulator